MASLANGPNGNVVSVGSNGINHGDAHVQEVVRAAHEELRQLIKQRAEIMKRRHRQANHRRPGKLVRR